LSTIWFHLNFVKGGWLNQIRLCVMNN